MSRCPWLLALVPFLLAAFGCGSDDREAARQTVTDYLEACRGGDPDRAEALLSVRARDQTRQAQQDVTFARSDTASFQVGQVELVDPDLAHVDSVWTDEGQDSPITWALRREDAGWRITAMQVPETEGGTPTLWLNFEEPEPMTSRQQFVDRSTP